MSEEEAKPKRAKAPEFDEDKRLRTLIGTLGDRKGRQTFEAERKLKFAKMYPDPAVLKRKEDKSED